MRDAKAALRKDTLARRDLLGDRPARSGWIRKRVQGLEAWDGARVVSSFVGVGSEVATAPMFDELLERRVRLAVPVVRGEDLLLVRLDDPAELEPAAFGLLEPPARIADAPDRWVDPGTVDLFLVPGLAFDAAGGRVGYGKGYYDRLLRRGPAGLRVALGFDCQLVDRVPMGPEDEPMDLLITESQVLRFSERAASKAP